MHECECATIPSQTFFSISTFKANHACERPTVNDGLGFRGKRKSRPLWHLIFQKKKKLLGERLNLCLTPPQIRGYMSKRKAETFVFFSPSSIDFSFPPIAAISISCFMLALRFEPNPCMLTCHTKSALLKRATEIAARNARRQATAGTLLKALPTQLPGWLVSFLGSPATSVCTNRGDSADILSFWGWGTGGGRFWQIKYISSLFLKSASLNWPNPPAYPPTQPTSLAYSLVHSCQPWTRPLHKQWTVRTRSTVKSALLNFMLLLEQDWSPGLLRLECWMITETLRS